MNGMDEENLFDALVDLFHEGQAAHQEAFSDVDGVDPDWPRWYARFLVDRVNQLLGTDLTASQLTDLLVTADREHKAQATHGDWKKDYAYFLLHRLT